MVGPPDGYFDSGKYTSYDDVSYLHPPPDSRVGLVLNGFLEIEVFVGWTNHRALYVARGIRTRLFYAVKAFDKHRLSFAQEEWQEQQIKLYYSTSKHSETTWECGILDSIDSTFVVTNLPGYSLQDK